MPKKMHFRVASPGAARGFATALRILRENGVLQLEVETVGRFVVTVSDPKDQLNIRGYDDHLPYEHCIYLGDQTEISPFTSDASDDIWNKVRRSVQAAYPEEADDILHSIRHPTPRYFPYQIWVRDGNGFKRGKGLARKHLDKAKKDAPGHLAEVLSKESVAEGDDKAKWSVLIHKRFDAKLVYIYPEDAPLRIAKDLEQESTEFFGEGVEEDDPT